MANNLKRLFSDTMIYGVSSIVGRFLNYLLVPLYTYKIAASSGGYGVVTELYAYTALMLVILTFGMETTFFYFANKNKDRAESVFSTSALTVGSVSALFVILLGLLLVPVSKAMGYAAHPEYVMMMGCVVALDAHPGLMRWYNPDWQVGYVFAVNLLCTAGVTLGFLPELGYLRHGIDRSLVRKMLRYTWPLLLLGVAGILNQVADKIIYRHLVPGPDGEVQLGIYGACVKIAMIMALITQAFRYAYEPFVFGGGRSRESSESQAAVMKYFVIFALLAFLVVMAYLDIFKYIIHSGYWEGLRAVPVVMMAEILMSVYFNLSFWYKLAGKTWWGAVFSAAGCVVLLAVNIFGVPRFGYMACAWGGVAGYGVCVLLSYCVGHKLAPVPYDVKRILAYFVLALSLYGLSVWFRPEPLGWRLAWNTLLVAVYFAAALWFERDLWLPALRRKKG